MTVGSWNVHTLQDNSNNPDRRTAVTSNILKKYNIDIVTLSETRFPGNGQLQEDGYTFYRVVDQKMITPLPASDLQYVMTSKKLEEIPVGINERLIAVLPYIYVLPYS